MEIEKLTEQILEITNNSDYGWIDLDSSDADRIRVALTQAMNYIPCCKSDSEQLHTEVFNLANKLAINGYGNEAVKMHQICNGM